MDFGKYLNQMYPSKITNPTNPTKAIRYVFNIILINSGMVLNRLKIS
ncbi:MAG: hypothetical protein IGBAC_1293 [Ignavibacteriae bacterium]|nr:MAG: hypothetical protein IGBAC_1293 [Ignavibacteriota bacterium]